jgi:hypothetical protein
MTTPSALSDRLTPCSGAGPKRKVPSDCQAPPFERWSTLTLVVPPAWVIV